MGDVLLVYHQDYGSWVVLRLTNHSSSLIKHLKQSVVSMTQFHGDLLQWEHLKVVTLYLKSLPTTLNYKGSV